MKSAKTYCGAFVCMFILTIGTVPISYAGTSTDKTSIEEVKRETEELMQALKAYTADQKEEAIQETKMALRKLDRRIDELESDVDNTWDKMDKAARSQARASLKALHRQRTELAEKYGSLKTSSAEAWAHMKKGFSEAYKALYDAWEKSEKEFGSDK